VDVTMNNNAAPSSWYPWFVLPCALGVAFMLIMIACKTAGSSVAAATDAERTPDDARQSKAGGRKGQAQSPKAASNSPEAVAATMWQKIMTACPVQGSAKPAMFYEQDVYDLLDKLVGHRVLEFRDTWTVYYANNVSEADRLNGIRFRGLAALGYSAYRDISFDSRNPLAPRAWAQFEGGTATRTEPKGTHASIMAVEIEQRNGQCFFKTPLQANFNPDSIAANKRSCAALTSADPFAAK
jgi:hypothetical protein